MSEVADSTEARFQSLNQYNLFTEHSNADKVKKRRIVADSVTTVGESGDRGSGSLPWRFRSLSWGGSEAEGPGTGLRRPARQLLI